MKKKGKTPRPIQSIWPYDPRLLQACQEELEDIRRRESDKRLQALYKRMTPEQQKEQKEFEESIRRWKGNSENDTPPALLAKLSKQQQKIVSLLWEGPMTQQAFVETIWPKPTNPEACTKAIQRLNRRFEELGECYVVCRKGDFIELERPDNL
ncbi:MAG: hypothetical protein JXM70_05235 [Pirellulales bacterium]|nr:hypothetical protein [Pirellulales bacterium]